ncbi:hypothetical protein H5410_040844 [Solanum commersonii]|uniref:Uncharacterized protein n=1 Tax=Solanum commersonii TaxID=4109 RepID=A0A9J5XRB2_SOLCO|nr:hypothetical protein H5410_040844 [Solanum commersonii]
MRKRRWPGLLLKSAESSRGAYTLFPTSTSFFSFTGATGWLETLGLIERRLRESFMPPMLPLSEMGCYEEWSLHANAEKRKVVILWLAKYIIVDGVCGVGHHTTVGYPKDHINFCGQVLLVVGTLECQSGTVIG